MIIIEYLNFNKRYLVLNTRLDSINAGLKIKKTSVLTLTDRIDELKNYNCDDIFRIDEYYKNIYQLKKEISTYQLSKISVSIKLCSISLFTPVFWNSMFTK